MNKVKNIIKTRPEFIIILVTLLIGIFSIQINDPQRVAPDSYVYHNLAVNIALGNGYSNSTEEPFEEYYFREPGYPYFLGIIYSVSSLFFDIDYITNYNSEDRRIHSLHKEIVMVRYFQLILIALSVLFFYKTMLFFVMRKYAIITSLILSSYYPFVNYCNNIMREPLLIFLIALMSYLSILYIHKKKLKWLSFLSIIISLTILTFQAMLVYLILPIIICLFNHKFKRNFWIHGLVSYVVIILTLSPWLIKVYNYYPDIRIIKTVGCSLTYESAYYIGSARQAYRKNTISENELRKIERRDWYDLSSYDIFEKSFTGWYRKEGNKLRSQFILTRREKNHRIFNQIGRTLKNTLIHNNWNPDPGFKDALRDKRINLVLHLYSLFIGATALFGFILFPKKKLIYVLPYLILLIFFYRIGGEGRRLIPSFPIIILFLTFFLYRIISRMNINEGKRVNFFNEI